jgi:hypothetical protein
MPSAQNATSAAVAGPTCGFNEGLRLAMVVLSLASTARAAAPEYEPPLTGLVIGVEVGILAAAIMDARAPRSWGWAMGLAGAAGVGVGFWAGSLGTEPNAPLVLRATAIGLAIPATILLWSHLEEPPSLSASEDRSMLSAGRRAPEPRSEEEKMQ